MATVFEFDQKYETEDKALRALPAVSGQDWTIVGEPGVYRLRLVEYAHPLEVMRRLMKLYPLRTFRVTQTDDHK